MKYKYKVFALFLIAALILSFVSVSVSAKEEKEPIDKVTFIHYKDGTVKELRGATPPKAEKCYKLMGVKWSSLPVNYVINPTNPQGLSESFVTTVIYNSAETWDAETSKELFNNVYTIDYSATLESSSPDSKNEYVFGVYPDSRVIAVTNIWYTRYRGQIVDYDVLFNTYYTWGDADPNNDEIVENPLVMDLQNIATHETGHGLGLSDLYSGSCSAVTMYGYSDYGEIQKRDLAQSDITGLQKIYGI